MNKKIKKNSKLSLTGMILTEVSATPTITQSKLTLEDMKYFLIATAYGFIYTTCSNLYRNKYLKEDKLLTSGLYNIHRNPEYVGDMIFGVSIGAMVVNAFYDSGNSIATTCTLLTMGLMIRGKNLIIDRDDLKLEERFGDEFRKFKKSVPKYIPKISNLFK